MYSFILRNFFKVCIIHLFFIFPVITWADSLNQTEKLVLINHKMANQSQQRINNIENETNTMRAKYLDNERLSDVNEAYNYQVSLMVDSQEHELADLNLQLQSIEETEVAVLPMLSRMVETLGKFVAEDLPFLNDERQKRLSKLDELLLRADVSVAEKYRQILEAYMVEVQYGRTFEAYSGQLEQLNSNRQVYYLRLGRTAFYYQALNGQESGLWQHSIKQWQILTQEQGLTLRKAIQIAQQQQVPSLIDLPLPMLESNS